MRKGHAYACPFFLVSLKRAGLTTYTLEQYRSTLNSFKQNVQKIVNRYTALILAKGRRILSETIFTKNASAQTHDLSLF